MEPTLPVEIQTMRMIRHQEEQVEDLVQLSPGILEIGNLIKRTVRLAIRVQR